MRWPRRQLGAGVTLVVAGTLVLLALLALHESPDSLSEEYRYEPPTEQLSSGERYVVLGSLENSSRFDIPSGIEPYPWLYFELSRWRRQVIEAGFSKVLRAPRDGPESHELVTVVNASLAELRRQTGDSTYTRSDALGGRYRFLPGAGVQYELYFRTRDSGPAGFHTVRVTRPVALPRVRYVGRGGQQMINIILPYYNRLSVLQRFIDRFTALVKEKQELTLTVVRYSNGFPTMDADQAQKDRVSVGQMIGQTNERLAGFGKAPRVRLVEKTGTFSRGGALMEGARAWDGADDVVLFLCDVDMLFGKSFLQRCRANTAPARRAYFPIVFSTYNPEIVFDVVKKKVVPIVTSYEENVIINTEMGYWIDFGFGMSCQYHSDFQRLSGSFFDITGWGLEDVRLYKQFQESDIEIVRAPDPDLIHVYHKKQCHKREVGDRFNSCLKSKAQNEASRLGWGLWVYKHMGDTDEIEEFLKVYRSMSETPGGG